MRQKRSKSLFIFYCLLFPLASEAQNQISDTGIISQSEKTAIKFYTTAIGVNSHLYNGVEYVYSYHGMKGHQFFKTDKFSPGNIYYDGALYTDINLLYDIVEDELVMRSYQNQNIKLIKDKIDSFSLLGHHFIKMYEDGSRKSGFYDLTRKGSLSLLIKRKKEAVQALKGEDPYQLKEFDRFFVKKENVYYEANNPSSLLQLFGDHKSEVKRFMRKHKFKFKKDPENTIVKTIEYYDQITK